MSIERWKSRQIRFYARVEGISYTKAKEELERQEAEKEK